MVSPSKMLRNKRRLVAFLLSKLEQKEKINIEIFQLSSATFMRTKHLLNSNNAVIYPEARFVPLFATFQESINPWQDDFSSKIYLGAKRFPKQSGILSPLVLSESMKMKTCICGQLLVKSDLISLSVSKKIDVFKIKSMLF